MISYLRVKVTSWVRPRAAAEIRGEYTVGFSRI